MDSVRTAYDTFKNISNDQEKIIRVRKKHTALIEQSASDMLHSVKSELIKLLNADYPDDKFFKIIDQAIGSDLADKFGKKTIQSTLKIKSLEDKINALPTEETLNADIKSVLEKNSALALEQEKLNKALILEASPLVQSILSIKHKAPKDLYRQLSSGSQLEQAKAVREYVQNNYDEITGASLYKRSTDYWIRNLRKILLDYNRSMNVSETDSPLRFIATAANTRVSNLNSSINKVQITERNLNEKKMELTQTSAFLSQAKKMDVKNVISNQIREDFITDSLSKEGLQKFSSLFDGFPKKIFVDYSKADGLYAIVVQQKKITASIEKFKRSIDDGISKLSKAIYSNPSFRTKINSADINKKWLSFRASITPQNQAIEDLCSSIDQETSFVKNRIQENEDNFNHRINRNRHYDNYPDSSDDTNWIVFWQTYALMNLSSWNGESGNALALIGCIPDIKGLDIQSVCRTYDIPELNSLSDAISTQAFDGAGINIDLSSINNNSFTNDISVPSVEVNVPSIDIPSITIDTGSSFDGGGGSFDGGGGGFD